MKVSENTSGGKDRPIRAHLEAASGWEDLKHVIKEVVEEINRADDLRYRTGGLEFQSKRTDSMRVKNHSAHPMTISMNLLPSSIEILSDTVVEEFDWLVEQSRQLLEINMDQDGQVVFQNNQGKSWSVEDAVFNILRPFSPSRHWRGRLPPPNSKIRQ